MTAYLLLALLLAAPLFVRCLLFSSRDDEDKASTYPFKAFLPWVGGVAQDYLYAFELFLLCRFLPRSWAVVAVALLQSYLIADAYLYRKIAMRLKLSFLRYLLEGRFFLSSAWELGALRASLFLAFFFCGYAWLLATILPSSPTYAIPLPIALAAIIALAVVVCSFLKKGMRLADFDNGWIAEQWRALQYLCRQEWLRYLFSRFFRQSGVDAALKARINPGSFEGLRPQNEEYEPLSPRYPLLKMTHGFFGDTLFDIDVKDGEKPHLVILSLESFRAKDIGVLGGSHGASPCFDAWAKRGVLFTNYYCAGIPTARSVIATLFGIYSPVGPLLQETDPSYPLIGLADIFKSYGYSTSYLQSGPIHFMHQDHFFGSHGFDSLVGEEQIEKAFPDAEGTSMGFHDRYLLDYALMQLRGHDKQKQPAFLTIYTGSHHHPWQLPHGVATPPFDGVDPKSEYGRSLRTFYYSDAMLGRFLEDMESAGLLKKTVVVITADTGQPMGEHHNNFSLFKDLYEEHQHIPLLFLAEGRIKEPCRIDDLSGQVDLLPTLLDLMGMKGINHAIGSSLRRKSDSSKMTYCVNTHGRIFIGCRYKNYKLIVDGEGVRYEFYDLEKDPLERHELQDPQQQQELPLMVERVSRTFDLLNNLYGEKRLAPSLRASLVCTNDDGIDSKALLLQLKELSNINILDLSHSHRLKDDAVIAAAGSCSQLEILHLNGLRITDRALRAFFGKTEKLKTIGLAGCSLLSQDVLKELLSRSPVLRDVDLSDCPQIDGALFKGLSEKMAEELPWRILDLKDSLGIDLEAIGYLSQQATSLRQINLQGIYNIDDEALVALARGRCDLRIVSLLECGAITDKGIDALTERYNRLLEFSCHAPYLNDASLRCFAARCRGLMKLFLIDAPNFTSKGFVDLFKGCRSLEVIYIKYASGFDDTALEALAAQPIGTLHLSHCPNVTRKGLQALSTLPLRSLVIDNCSQVTREEVKELAEALHATTSLRKVVHDFSEIKYEF